MNPHAIIKIQMIQGSRRCLWLGLLGSMPLVGLPFSLAALRLAGGVRQKEKLFWNAAKSYRIIGASFAAFFAILWSTVIIFVIGNIIWFGWFAHD